jgi:hypothetical protein
LAQCIVKEASKNQLRPKRPQGIAKEERRRPLLKMNH